MTEAKEDCAHGEWLPWLKKEFGWAERTARNYMHVYDLFKSANFADLKSLDVSALYLLAAPSTPAGIRVQAVERAARGESLRRVEVKKMIDEAAEAPAPPRRSIAQSRTDRFLPGTQMGDSKSLRLVITLERFVVDASDLATSSPDDFDDAFAELIARGHAAARLAADLSKIAERIRPAEEGSIG